MATSNDEPFLMRYDVFTPLAPAADYPALPVVFQHDVPYRLFLTAELSDALFYTVTHKGGLCRVLDLEDEVGLGAVRRDPEVLQRLQRTCTVAPPFTIVTRHIAFPRVQEAIVSGVVYRHLLLSEPATEQLLDWALEGIFKKSVRDQLFYWVPFMRLCGGWEVLQARFYLDPYERGLLLNEHDHPKASAFDFARSRAVRTSR